MILFNDKKKKRREFDVAIGKGVSRVVVLDNRGRKVKSDGFNLKQKRIRS